MALTYLFPLKVKSQPSTQPLTFSFDTYNLEQHILVLEKLNEDHCALVHKQEAYKKLSNALFSKYLLTMKGPFHKGKKLPTPRLLSLVEL